MDQVLLTQLNNFIESSLGLHFREDRFENLKRGIIIASREFGYQDPQHFVSHILASQVGQEQIDKLASCLTIGETFFFREKATFCALEEYILPELIRTREEQKTLRVWSAGCGSGEEPYSLAILLHRFFEKKKNWTYTVLGTDINPRVLEIARKGVYSGWSFRDSPTWLQREYFKEIGPSKYELQADILRKVRFEYLNLVEDAYPSITLQTNAIDLVFCQNVLMYFTPEATKKVLRGFFQSLVHDGWLVLGNVESMVAQNSPFFPVRFDGTTLYLKRRSSVREERIGRKRSLNEVLKELYKEEEREESLVDKDHMEIPLHVSTLPDPSPLTANEESRFDRAVRFYNAGNTQDAMNLLLQGAEDRDQPEALPSMLLLARIFANAGRLNKSAEWCEKCIQLDKLNPHVHYLYALVKWEQEDTEGAFDLLRRTLYLDQNFVMAQFTTGNFLLASGKKEQSKKHFRNVRDLLFSYSPDEILPHSEGMTVGRLAHMLETLMD